VSAADTAPRDRWLIPLALVAGLVFFSSLGRLWPLADADLTVPSARLDARARQALAERGFDPTGYTWASALDVDERSLDYVEQTFGRDHAQALLTEGLPLVTYPVLYRKRGEPNSLSATLHPSGAVVGWSRELQEDEPAAEATTDQARALATAELAEGLGLDVAAWHEAGVSTRERPARVDRVFTFERTVSAEPELRERAFVVVAGDRVVSAYRAVVVPGPAAREARSREAAPQALWYVGLILLSAAVVGAFTVFLVRLRDGSVRLGPAALWSTVVFVCAFGTQFLQDYSLLAAWDPLWPRWISALRYLVLTSQEQVWTFIVLLAVIAAGDELDRRAGAGRGETLWLVGHGRLADPRVGRSIARGFLVGLLCGGTLAAGALAFEAAGARISLQPRGFFFYALNSSAPAVATLLFFTNVALLEELGYRFFSGTWLLAVTKRPWVAVLAPAIVYGLTHTTLDFLPPAEPFWARAAVMTLVGCVWGWAFLRYDALTVVVSHLMADLFIFTWPRLASGDPWLVAIAVATIAAPLALAVPSAISAARYRERR
jgi:hypothetical protein